MSKVMLALGSFIVGACCAVSILLGSHTSTLVQPVLAQRGIVVEGAEPVVPPLRGNAVRASTFRNIMQPLDGLEIEDSVFENVRLEYSGGAFRLANRRFLGTTRVNLKGAAANTLGILPLIQASTSGKPPVPLRPRTPIQRTATAKQEMVISLASPYGQK